MVNKSITYQVTLNREENELTRQISAILFSPETLIGTHSLWPQSHAEWGLARLESLGVLHLNSFNGALKTLSEDFILSIVFPF